MKVAVVGAGIMGSGIAQLAAMSGHEAVARDVDERSLDQARASVERSLERFTRAERLTAEEAAGALARLSFTTDLASALDGADAVVEAVPEVFDLKASVWAAIKDGAPADALLTTNTSHLSITALATTLGDQAARLVGVHFFNPAVMMELVEVVPALQADARELDRARAFAEGLGRRVVVCGKDSPGFITSRAYAALRLECIRLLEDGVASAEDIDVAMRLGFNLPIGPLALGDRTGLDTYVHVLDGLADAHGERFRPTVGLRNMVAANHLGLKTGRGFYDYAAADQQEGTHPSKQRSGS